MIKVENEQAGRSYHFHNLEAKQALIIAYADAEKGEENIASRHEELFDKYGELVETNDEGTLKIGNWYASSID